jgi:hypothetical protein
MKFFVRLEALLQRHRIGRVLVSEPLGSIGDKERC